MLKQLQAFLKDEEGVTAIEYGLIAALVGIIAVAAMTTAGANLTAIWTTIGAKLN
jgi:pilus assembly protein Flp/PilA